MLDPSYVDELIDLEHRAEAIHSIWTRAYETCTCDEDAYVRFAQELKECMSADAKAGSRIAANVLSRLAVAKEQMFAGDDSAVLFLKDNPDENIDDEQVVGYVTLAIINTLGLDVMMEALDEGVRGEHL